MGTRLTLQARGYGFQSHKTYLFDGEFMQNYLTLLHKRQRIKTGRIQLDVLYLYYVTSFD